MNPELIDFGSYYFQIKIQRLLFDHSQSDYGNMCLHFYSFFIDGEKVI